MIEPQRGETRDGDWCLTWYVSGTRTSTRTSNGTRFVKVTLAYQTVKVLSQFRYKDAETVGIFAQAASQWGNADEAGVPLRLMQEFYLRLMETPL